MLRFWELAPSPNNLKVRLALRSKGVEFEAVPVDAADRSPVVQRSGQPLTPVIEDRGIVLNDSEAILHYLDANYPDAPRLWPADREGRYRSDAFKRELDERVARPWLPIFLTAIGRAESYDDGDLTDYADGLAWLDGVVGDGGRATVDDLRIAEWALYALPGDALERRVGLFRKFREMYGIEAGRFPGLERFLAPWQERAG